MSLLLIELGIVILGLGILARLASKLGLSAIPLYLLAGLAFGNGGLLPLQFSEDFVHLGAEIGVILLLFLLGLDHSGDELTASLRSGIPSGLMDLGLNFPPGFAAGLLLGWSPLAAFLLGGITYISSSGVIAQVLTDLGRLKNPETRIVISTLVLEDLAMALYLPLVAVLLADQGLAVAAFTIAGALTTVSVILLLALRHGKILSRVISHQSDQVILFTAFGLVLLVAGVAQQLHVSAAVGAFLIGIALSGPIAERAHRLLASLRDLFAAIFFLFFGLQVDPATLPPILATAGALALITTLTKVAFGWWAARSSGLSRQEGWKAGTALIARGEFSIVIAGMAVAAGVEPQLGVLSTAYVLLLATAGPVLTRYSEALSSLFGKQPTT
jgi:monovalent cation:H+ antiporter-2, CPA2 family